MRRWPASLLVILAGFLALGPSAALAQTEEEVAEANNPIAPLSAINLHNYYVPTIYGSPNDTSNTLNMRGIFATESMVVRATLPLSTVPTGGGSYESGIGDLTVFDAFLLPPKGNTQVGVGPLLVFPTASKEVLGAGKYQAGAVVVFTSKPAPTLMFNSIITYQHSFANSGSVDHPTASAVTAMPILILQVGGGWYLRSTGTWNFDLEARTWYIPFGVGAGKVTKVGRAVLNIFIEPQFTALHHGDGQPAVQIFAGFNTQFPKKKE